MQPTAIARLTQATLETWKQVSERVGQGEPADVTLQNWWKTHRYYGSRDRRFIGDAVFAAFRWRGWFKDAALPPERLLGFAFLLESSEAHPAATLLAGPDSAPEPAGTLSLVEKAKWLAHQMGWDTPPTWHDLVPGWVASVIDPAHLESFVRSVQVRPPLWLRAPQGQGPALATWLAQQGLTATPHPQLPEALALERTPSTEIIRGIEERKGTVQDILSQSVGWACQARPGQRWWDLCAGSGGKTLQLLESLQGQGHVLATDIRESPLRELERRTRSYARQLTIRLLRSDTPPPGGPFDGILIDAPCSGLGTWGRNPDARWRTTLETVSRMAATQRQLVERALPHLKPGGTLVFSTCSVSEPEGSAVLHPFAQQLIPSPWSFPPAGPTPESSRTLWPEEGPGTGMFVARYKRQ